MDIYDRMTDIFRSVFDNEEIELEDSMTADDIKDWDSLAHVTLIFALEGEFGIHFSTKELERMHSVGNLKSIINGKL